MALVAQEERNAISKRTTEALAAAKARGVKLGNPDNLSKEAAERGRAAGVDIIKTRADDFAQECIFRINLLREIGLSFNGKARILNKEGILTATGKSNAWTARSVVVVAT